MTPEDYVDQLAATGWFAVLPDPDAERQRVLKEAKILAGDGRDVRDAAMHLLLTADYADEGDYERELMKVAKSSQGLFKPTGIAEIWGEMMRFRFVLGEHKFGVKRSEHEEFATEIFPSMVLNAGRHVPGKVLLHPVPLDRDHFIAYVWGTDETIAAARAADLLPWDASMEPVIRDVLMVIADLPGMDHLAPEEGFSFKELDTEVLAGDWESDDEWDDDDLLDDDDDDLTDDEEE